MRIFKFIGVFLAVFLFIIAIIVVPSWDAVKTIFENKNDITQGSEWLQRISSDRGLVNFVQANPKYVSIVSYNVSKPDSGIYFQARTKRELGTLSTILLAIEYARQVQAGSINPDKRVSLKKMARLNLPKVYTTYHLAALKELKNDHKIKNGTISIHELVRIALQTNDLAASDYLYLLLGPKNVEKIPEQLHLKNIEAPLPWAGMEISWNPSLYHQSVKQRFTFLKSMPAAQYRKMAVENTKKLLTNDAYYQKVKKAFQHYGLHLLFSQEKKFYELTPKGSPLELAHLLGKIVQDSLISPTISEQIKKFMQWNVSGPMMKKLFISYGGTYDSRIGLLTGADYGTGIRRPGKHVQVICFNDLPLGVWFHISSDFMNESFQQKFIWNKGFYEYAYHELMKPGQ